MRSSAESIPSGIRHQMLYMIKFSRWCVFLTADQTFGQFDTLGMINV